MKKSPLLTKRLLDMLEAEGFQDPARKLLWLVQHLDEYLGRWVAEAFKNLDRLEAAYETLFLVTAELFNEPEIDYKLA